MLLHPKHLESLLGKVLAAPPLPTHSSYSAKDLCTSVLILSHHSLCNKDKYKDLLHMDKDLDSKTAQRSVTVTMCCTKPTHHNSKNTFYMNLNHQRVASLYLQT